MLEWLERIAFVVVVAIGLQSAIRARRTSGEPAAGWSWSGARDAALGRQGSVASVAFWGCVVLAVNAIRIVVRVLVPAAAPAPTTGLAGGGFLLLKDLAQGAGVITACMAARPAWRERILELVPALSPPLLLWLGILAASGLIYEAGALAAHRGDAGYLAEAPWEPLTTRLAVTMLVVLGPMPASVVGSVAWWLHLVATLMIAHRGGIPSRAGSLPSGQD